MTTTPRKTKSVIRNYDDEIAALQRDLDSMVKHAYTCVYVTGIIRAWREDCTFYDAVCAELEERGAFELANLIIEFELHRLGIEIKREPVSSPAPESEGDNA